MEKIKKEGQLNTEQSNCGIVMPISAIDNCSADHWKDVLKIISESAENSGFIPRLVSESDDSGIIQKTIIHNLYEDPIVIVDVSGKNPNVMFELGLRLAFDKPTIVVKDDKTSYSFDTSPIEHLSYPRDLRYQSILDFKEKLKDKIVATYKKATTDENYTTFLKHFGTFKIAKLDEKVVGKEEFIIKSIQDLKEDLLRSISKQKLNDTDTPVANITKLMVENKMKDFIIDRGLKTLWDIKTKKLNGECLSYLWTDSSIKKVCGTPTTLNHHMMTIIEDSDNLPF